MGMVVEAPIPRHITGIYVFAVVNLIVMLCMSTVDAEIIVKDTLSNETAAHYPDTKAKFGPDFPPDGLEGRLMYAEPDPEACSGLDPPPLGDDTYPWILLVARGGNCQFSEKVLNAQLQNYSAVIVHNYDHKDSRIPMGGGNNGSKVMIPSTFIGWQSGMNLRRLYDYKHREYIIRIWEDSIDYSNYVWPFLLVMAICILMVMIFMLLKFLRDHASRRLSRLSNKHLKKIPVRKFKKGDYYDTCAICLDEYEEGEKIRVLPCDHVYHRKCIDPWLTKNKKTCPVCKRRVIPGRDADSESGSEADEAGVSSGRNENTPLLGNRSAHPPSQQYGGSSASGSTATSTLQESRAILPADSTVERGAVGGVGISYRTYQTPATVTTATSSRGNIQDPGYKRDARSEKRRKRRMRDYRRRREEEDEHGGHREEVEAASTSQNSTTAAHKDRKKKRKDKRRAENTSSLLESNPMRNDGEKMMGRSKSERAGPKKDVLGNVSSDERETASVLVRIEEEYDDRSYLNPGFSGNYAAVAPAASRGREMNEVV